MKKKQAKGKVIANEKQPITQVEVSAEPVKVTPETDVKKVKEKRKIDKKSVIIYSVSGAVVLALGIAAGVLVGQNTFKQTMDYSQFDTGEIEVDYSQKYEEFKKTNSSKYFTAFTPVELANISLLKLGDIDSFYSQKEGSVIAAGVEQTINAYTIKNGNRYFEENISSSSFVKAANRFYQEGESVDWYKGKYVSPTKGSYPDSSKTEYTLESFEEVWGGTKDRGTIYIISEQTVLSSEIKDNSDGTKTIALDLDPTLSVIRYVKQMKMTGGLSQEPIFHSVHLDFTVDEQLKLLEFFSDEYYDVHMVIDAKNSNGKISQKFKYEEKEIPGIDTDINYES